ncbi:glycoside hydrolase superfamily [Protomyces lactucae-debilis]|uniref:cellulase n=1 Tax=Protomyces lactucae-debilis TaxID=2754530 RepID=A0A1Y2FPF4_PROLT|nr:glycoside hydrolase superfamily [Protomyces lactucae-debilis]ORY85086.1 glycoside hydrolase superfamily [Protomyces lactucae-debilis]
MSTLNDAINNVFAANGGAKVIIDLHCYGRRDGAVIGAGGPTIAQFADFWARVAALYKGNGNIIFGLINEPHDQDAATLFQIQQAAVKAIRNAGATSQPILLSAGEWSHVSGMQSNAAGLFDISDTGRSSKSLLWIDLHAYLDSDGSGTSRTCTTDQATSFASAASLLSSNGRQALVTEIGGSSEASCVKFLAQALDAIGSSPAQYLGWAGWSAGAFSTSYELSMVPNGDGSDQEITKVFARAGSA